MRGNGRAAALSILLFVVISCDQPANTSGGMSEKYSYSLCPTKPDSRQELDKLMRDFADQQRAELIDRSAGVEQELSRIGKDVLELTGGKSILLTVEKPSKFRISVTNLELREKVALTIRYWAADEGGHVRGLLDEIGRSWRVQRVEGGVSNDPPCSSAP